MKNGSEIENVIEAKKNFFDKISSEDFFEKDKYYADKAGKYCRNCNSIFGLENKLHQHLQFEIARII
jgi:hypothetical protein